MPGRKLLFITSNRLGDAVLSTGLLHAALQRFTPDRVTVACGPIPAPLFAGVPKLAQVILLDKARGGMHWFDLWRYCVTQKWEAVIDIRNSFVSYLVPSRHAFHFTGGDHTKHKAEQLAALLNLSPPPASKLWITESAQQKAAQLMPSGAKMLALCPTANSYKKQWPWERFVEAARKLTASGPLAGARIAVFAAGNEREQAEPLMQDLRKTHEVADLVGKTNPLEAAACLAYCRFCLANDSGLMHLAAAMRVPTLGLFGPTNDVEYRPWGPNAAFLRGAALKKTDDPLALMKALTVDNVVAAAQKMLGA